MTVGLAMGGCADEEAFAPVGEGEDSLPVSFSADGVASVTPAGAPILDSRGQPLSFEGTVVYSNGLCTGQGISCGETSESYRARAMTRGELWPLYRDSPRVATQPRAYGMRWQCVELVKRHFATRYGVDTSGWTGNAQDMGRNAPSGTVFIANNGSPSRAPVAGDALILGGGTYGHIAIVANVTRTTIETVDQNVHRERGFLLQHAWDGSRARSLSLPDMSIIGWVHANANTRSPGATGTPSTPSTPSTPAAECTSPGSWTCSRDNTFRYRCVSQRWETERCSAGCDSRIFADDVCNAPPAAEQPVRPAGDVCADFTTCGTCTAENGCGWCDGRCISGTETGPIARFGTCSRTAWAWTTNQCTGSATPTDFGPCPGTVTSTSFFNCTPDGRARYVCRGGRMVQFERCATSCEVRSVGEDDVCR